MQNSELPEERLLGLQPPSIRYGYCHICSAPISIPGLDGSRCPRCGWINPTKVVHVPPPSNPASYKPTIEALLSSSPLPVKPLPAVKDSQARISSPEPTASNQTFLPREDER